MSDLLHCVNCKHASFEALDDGEERMMVHGSPSGMYWCYSRQKQGMNSCGYERGHGKCGRYAKFFVEKKVDV